MNIEPNSKIYLLRNVPLDNTYTDTMWFENASSQWTHFKTRADTNGEYFPAQTYQRKDIGVIRLDISADEIYDCNYLMFQNTNYGSKWFYSFITKVEYVNNAVSYVYYELDVMQTWMFDYTLEMCMVEREHSTTDQIGENIMAEPFDMGDYICEDWETDPWITQNNTVSITGRGDVPGGYCVLVCCAQQQSGN